MTYPISVLILIDEVLVMVHWTTPELDRIIPDAIAILRTHVSYGTDIAEEGSRNMNDVITTAVAQNVLYTAIQ